MHSTARRILRLHGAQQERVLCLIRNVCPGTRRRTFQYTASYLSFLLQKVRSLSAAMMKKSFMKCEDKNLLHLQPKFCKGWAFPVHCHCYIESGYLSDHPGHTLHITPSPDLHILPRVPTQEIKRTAK